MTEYIAIPKLGMSMTEATLVEWKAGDGDKVAKGDVVLLIETEKTQWEVEAAGDGWVHILVEQDVVAPVSRVVGLIAESEAELETLRRDPPGDLYSSEAGEAQAAALADAAAVTDATAAPTAPVPSATPVARPGERVRISPVARKMAEEHMVDVAAINGSGPGGRIVREDIQRAIDEKGKAPADAAATAAVGGKRVKSTIPLKSIRKSIAEHMQRSLAVSAQLTQMGEIDASELQKFRETLVAGEERLGARITYSDILVAALARALGEIPIINSSLIREEIILWEDINIGVAVAIEGGLIVPVVMAADRKSLVEINQTLRGLVDRARTGKLMPDDVSGSTFTLTNLGAFGGGWGFGTPIINQPEAAILGTGPITDRPVACDGEVVVRPVMTYSFTFDHRVFDGAPAAQFMVRLTEILETPALLLL